MFKKKTMNRREVWILTTFGTMKKEKTKKRLDKLWQMAADPDAQCELECLYAKVDKMRDREYCSLYFYLWNLAHGSRLDAPVSVEGEEYFMPFYRETDNLDAELEELLSEADEYDDGWDTENGADKGESEDDDSGDLSDPDENGEDSGCGHLFLEY